MSTAFIFPGQASQFIGMGQSLYNKKTSYKSIFEVANDIMGFNLAQVMFDGPEEKLKETVYTQPAVFLHSYLVHMDASEKIIPEAMAGHSLGEITALVVAGVLSFEQGMYLVKRRAEAMQMACDQSEGTMAAILGMEDAKVEEICDAINEIVIAANYNCPGQLVISGSRKGVAEAMKACQEAGAKRALEISVGGAFHSALMQPAMDDFQKAVAEINFSDSTIPIYQNVDGLGYTSAEDIKANLISQLVSPVKWTQSVQNMIQDGVDSFIEIGGKGKILMGMVRKISRDVNINVWIENE
jgi:[acyl-carrier-protein] S-malonyltransferase